MKRLVPAMGLAAVTLTAITTFAAQEGAKGKAKKPAERMVAVPLDTTPFPVERKWSVRLTGEGIAGSQIEAAVAGPARITAVNALVRFKDGHQLIGRGDKEFELRPTGRGRVTVTITSKPPQPGAEPTVTKYVFEVQ